MTSLHQFKLPERNTPPAETPTLDNRHHACLPFHTCRKFTSLLLASHFFTPSHAVAVPNPQATTSPALPTPATSLDRRLWPPVQNLGVTICDSIYFSGVCKHVASADEVCVNLNTIEWTGGISSISPDPGVSCFVYAGYGCNAEDDSHANSDM
ncbi:hypothetical protein H2201_007919 [Coniosporium apollinis]|uniref:Hydrophobin n=2 Tax=Coniosporium TaxID=2810619 RepID=A0ABQ9NKG7_9PEZI|nr:hypothetical protein H2199_004882 [Cladosporium sp. JES 115]KAJ9658138.1 hypothetical protein H2201_007919 [Coniosporium apollinis]